MTKSWIKEMSNNGMEIGSHTVSHRYLTELPKVEIYEEFYASKCKLEDILRREIFIVSIPGGEHNSTIINLARETGYKIIITSIPGTNRLGTDIVRRISIHAKTTVQEVNHLLNFSKIHISKLKVSYFLRAFLKRSFGIENYMKFRNRLIKI